MVFHTRTESNYIKKKWNFIIIIAWCHAQELRKTRYISKWCYGILLSIILFSTRFYKYCKKEMVWLFGYRRLFSINAFLSKGNRRVLFQDNYVAQCHELMPRTDSRAIKRNVETWDTECGKWTNRIWNSTAYSWRMQWNRTWRLEFSF